MQLPEQALLYVKQCGHDCIMDNYFSHIGLASGNIATAMPYATIARNLLAFILAEYLLEGVKFRDPHNMRKDEILQFLQHIKRHVENFGIARTFRFSHYMSSNQLSAALYPNAGDLPSTTKLASLTPVAKKAKK